MIRGPESPECHALPNQTENLPERPPGSLCGDNPSGWAFEQMGQIHMGRANPFGALVAGHAADEFLPLREAVDGRRSRKEVGVGTLAEAAAAYQPDPGRPECGAGGAWEDRIDRGRGFKVALPLLRQEVHLPHRHRPRTLPKAAPRLDLLHQAHAPQRSRRVCGRGSPATSRTTRCPPRRRPARAPGRPRRSRWP